MSRRASAPTRTILPDPRFNSLLLAKFVNMVMDSGKKSVAEMIVYGAVDRITEKTGKAPDQSIELLAQALDNVKPTVEVKSRRVGGATYQVPVEVRTALGHRSGSRAQREVDGAAPGRRTPRCGREPRCGRAQARRHASHGRSQQSLRALPLVRAPHEIVSSDRIARSVERFRGDLSQTIGFFRDDCASHHPHRTLSEHRYLCPH